MSANKKILFVVLAAFICLFAFGAIKTLQVLADKRYAAELEAATTLLDEWVGNSDDLESAKMLLDDILANRPDSAPAHREYARYHIMSGAMGGLEVAPENLAAAEKSLENAIRLDPNYAASYVLGGHLYMLKQDKRKARTYLMEAQRIGTSDAWLHNNWGAVLMAEGNPEEAIKRYKRALVIPNRSDKATRTAYRGMIEAQLRLGQLDLVDLSYRKFIAVDRDYPWTHGDYAAFLLCQKDKPDAAIVEYKKVLEVAENSMAQEGVAASLSRQWATHVSNDETELANATLVEVKQYDPHTPLEIITEHCCVGPTLDAVAKASNVDGKPVPCDRYQGF